MTKTVEFHIHQSLIGKTCRLLPESIEICRALGRKTYLVERILLQQTWWSWRLIFIEEPPFRFKNRWLYCVKLVECEMGDWFWFPLECFMICSAE